MRDKLIDLLKEAHDALLRCGFEFNANVIADLLIREGVIVMPCKVGDDVYWIDPENEVVEKQEGGIRAVCYYDNGKFKVIADKDGLPEDLHTDWCMLTEEEANKRLLERNKK